MKTIAFSVSARRPGCVILQAAFGANVGGQKFADLFPSETWLTVPTPDMQVYEASDAQLNGLSMMARHAVGLPITEE